MLTSNVNILIDIEKPSGLAKGFGLGYGFRSVLLCPGLTGLL